MPCSVYLNKYIRVVHLSIQTFHATLIHNHFSLLSIYKFKFLYFAVSGYAMAEAWILFQTGIVGIYGGQSGTGTDLSPRSTSFL
jgi:hypothetical protein